MNYGEKNIRLEKSMAVRNESYVSFAIIASSTVYPVSANKNMTIIPITTRSHNTTNSREGI